MIRPIDDQEVEEVLGEIERAGAPSPSPKPEWPTMSADLLRQVMSYRDGGYSRDSYMRELQQFPMREDFDPPERKFVSSYDLGMVVRSPRHAFRIMDC